MELKTIFALFSFIGLTLAGPLTWSDESRCSRQCKQSSKFLYDEGTTYHYDFESANVFSRVDSSHRPTVPFTVRAKLAISKVGPCDMILEVKDAKFIAGADDVMVPEFADYALPFSFQDGKIEDICPHPSESVRILNIKKAMLSALQNSMANLNENDYVKEHRWKMLYYYQVQDSTSRSIVITKSKNLGSCEGRLGGNTAFMIPVIPVTNVLPVMKKEEYHCEQVIENRIITNVKCKESSQFAFFGDHKEELKTEAHVVINLERVQAYRNRPIYETGRRHHLLYSHEPERFLDSASDDALRILRDMCSRMHRETMVDPEMPRLFSQLVQVLRRVNPRELENIYDKAESGEICQSPWLKSLMNDALPYIGHEGSVRIMVKRIQSGAVSKFQTAYWVTSLAFIKHPSEGAISAAVPLLDYERAGKQAILGITAMCNNYCSWNTDCERSRALQQVIESLSRYLNYQCKVSGRREVNQVITALKGFGNLGRVGSASRHILECAAQPSNEITIRLAAIEAFRRTPCERDVKERLLDMFSRRDEQVEVRIAAYLGAMKCADKDLVRRVQQVYDSERLNQIKAFVYSHITNLQETSSPDKQDIRRIVREFQFQPQPLSILKYSQNIEWSSYFERIKLGGEFESNVIYTHDSFLPRSIMTNFSSFINDKVFNFMEVGARVEGLDRLLEKLFSPTGEYGHMSFSEFANYMMGLADKKQQPQWPTGTTSHRLQPKVNWFAERMTTPVPPDLRGSFYFKHMGSELLWVTIDERTDFNFGKAIDFMDILSELARTQKIDTAHSLYLDTCIDYPSISGGAISLDLNGTIIVGLKGEGKIDVRKALSSPQNVDINGKVRVSVAAEANAIMGYRSVSSSARAKYVFKAHGGVVIKGQLVIRDGRVFNMRIDLPEDRIDLLSVSVDVVRPDEYGAEVSYQPSRELKGCIQFLRSVIGHDICTELVLPQPIVRSSSPYVPISGPYATKISLLKHDRSMRALVLNIELPDHNVYSTKKLKIEFDTPGSSYDRKHSLEVVFVEPSSSQEVWSLDLQLRTPYKEAEARVAAMNSPEKKSLKVDLIVDRNRHWSLVADLEKVDSGNIVKYDTKLEISYPSSEPLQLVGSISCKKGRKTVISVNLHSNRPSRQPLEISGNFVKEGDITILKPANWKLSTDLRMKLPNLEARIAGTAHQSGKILSSDMTIDYTRRGRRRNTIRTNLKVQNLSSRSFTKLVTTAELHSSEYPHCNFQLDWDFQYKPMEHLENDLTIKGGTDLKKVLYFLQVSRVQKNGRDKFTSDNRIVITAPTERIDYEMKVSIDHDSSVPNSIIGAEIKKDQRICVKSSLKYFLMSRTPLQMGLDFTLEYPANDLLIKSLNQLDEISPNEYRGTSKLQWDREQEANFDYTYRIKSRAKNFHHEIDASFDAPWLRVPIEHKGLLKMSPKSLDIASSTSYKGKAPYKLNIKIAPKGPNKVNLDLPNYAKSDVQFDINSRNTLLKFDISRPQTNRRVVGHLRVASEPKIAAQMEINWDADRNPSARLAIETELHEMSSWSDKSYELTGKLQYRANVDARVRGKINSKLFEGPHDLQIDFEQQKPLSIKLHHEAKDGLLNCEFLCEYDNEQTLRTRATGKFITKGPRVEIACDAVVSSSNRRLDGKEIHFSHMHDLSDLLALKSELQISQTPDKQYRLKTEFTCTKSWNSKALKALLAVQTPVRGWKTREINLSAEKARDKITFDADLTTDEGRKLIVSGNAEKTEYGARLQCEIQTPASRKMQVAKVMAAYHLQPSNYKVQCQILIDAETKLDFNGNLVGDSIKNFDSNVEFKSYATPSFAAHMSNKMDRMHKEFDVAFKKNSIDKLSARLSTQQSRSDYTGSAELDVEGKRIVDANINCQDRGATKSCRLNLSGAMKPMVVNVDYRKEDSVIKPKVKICWESRYKSSECVEVEGHYKNENRRFYGKGLREIRLNIRRPREGDLSVEFLENLNKKNYQNKLIFASPTKKIGYDVHLDRQLPQKNAHLQIYLPSRVIKAQATLQTEREVILTAECQLDAERQPMKKTVLELFHKSNVVRSNREIFSKIELKHPELRKPICVKFELHSKEAASVHPVDAKLELEYSDNPKDNIICSVHLETAPSGQGNNTVVFNIHKQERRYLDFTLRSHLGHTRELISSGLEWEFSSQRNRRKSSFSLIQIMPLEKRFGVWHKCDMVKFEGIGNWVLSSDSVLKTAVDILVNDREPKKLDATIDYRQPCLDVSYYSRADDVPKSKYHFCVNSAGRNLLSISANTFHDSGKVTDFSLVFDSNAERAFTLDVKWMPKILGEILDYFSEISVRIQEIKDYIIPYELAQPIRDTFSTMKRNIYQPVYRSVARECSQLLDEIKSEMQNVKRSLRELYDRLPSKYEIERALQPLRKYIKDMQYELKMMWKELIPADILDQVREVKKMLSRQLDVVCEYGTYCYELRSEYRRYGLKGLVKELCRDLVDLLREKIKIQIKLGNIHKGLMKPLRAFWEAWSRQLDRVTDRIADIPIVLNDYMTEYGRSVGKAWNKLYRMYEDTVLGLLAFSFVSEDILMRNPDVRAIVNTAKEIRDEILQELRKVRLDKLRKELKDSIVNALYSLSLKDTTTVLVFDPDQGRLRVELYSPVNPRRLRHTLKSVWNHPLSKEFPWNSDSFQQSLDIITQPWFPPLPPFQVMVYFSLIFFLADAVLVGGQHFKTFDDATFSIDSDCSYLLMNDFIDRNFTIIAKHVGTDRYGQPQKSIVLLNADVSIEVNPHSSSVLLNDVPVELPVFNSLVSVIRDGDVIEVEDKRGLHVKCHLVYNFCTASISGWYHGKTAGLFGTLDYEPSTDFIDPSGKRVDSVDQFSKGWKISHNCKQNVLPQQWSDPSEEGYRICQRFFAHHESPLQPCFKRIPPQEYFTLCLRAPVESRFSVVAPSKSVCNIAASYASICKDNGYHVTLPAECLDCTLADGSKMEFEDMKTVEVDEDSFLRHQTFDMLFVIEESECNNELLRSLGRYATAVDKKLESIGHKNTRFGVMGYGGRNEEFKAHTHTARGAAFFPARDMDIAIRNMKLSYKQRSDLDVFAVLWRAAELPFRDNANKLIIVAPCHKCEISAMSHNYREMLLRLHRLGVYLHVWRNSDLDLISGKGEYFILSL
ncbi:apolipophorins-like [Centruroides vittatus]|uniref:apolipophorins-like n=1 Tax=Centruroides vittatus TaxID=120091 RepID=UPI00350F7663